MEVKEISKTYNEERIEELNKLSLDELKEIAKEKRIKPKKKDIVFGDSRVKRTKDDWIRAIINKEMNGDEIEEFAEEMLKGAVDSFCT